MIRPLPFYVRDQDAPAKQQSTDPSAGRGRKPQRRRLRDAPHGRARFLPGTLRIDVMVWTRGRLTARI
jgi:hypothetical protein